MPTRELYVQGTQEHQLRVSNPRTGRLKTTALAIGPSMSLARIGVSLAYGDRFGGWGGRVHYGVLNKGRLGSGVPHREPSVLHVIVEAVAGDLGASQASSVEGGGAEEGKSSCLMSRMGVARGERETAHERHSEDGSVRSGE